MITFVVEPMKSVHTKLCFDKEARISVETVLHKVTGIIVYYQLWALDSKVTQQSRNAIDRLVWLDHRFIDAIYQSSL